MDALNRAGALILPAQEAYAAALLVVDSKMSLALQGGRPHVEVAAKARTKLADRLG